MGREGEEALVFLKYLEQLRKHGSKEGPAMQPGSPERATEEAIERAWDNVRKVETETKQQKKWRQSQLDDFEADLTRYALIALLHHARETLSKEAEEQSMGDGRPTDVAVKYPEMVQKDSGSIQ